MTRVYLGGYADLGVGEFADRLTALGPLLSGSAPSGPERPSFVVRSRDRRWLYAVSEVTEGKVAALPAQGTGAQSRVRSGGADPCHLALSPAGDLLVVSNYSSGTVGLLSVDGGNLILQDTVHLTGRGPHQRQQSPHAHQATWLSEAEVVVCDLGSDTLAGLTVRPTGADGGVPRLTQRWSIGLPPGTGPRHLAVAPGGDRMWVVGELDNTVHTLVRDPQSSPTGRSGGWSLRQTLSLLPGGSPSTGAGPDRGLDWLAAGIVVDPSGGHVYVTVRGADQLVHLTVADDGKLTEVGRRDTAHWPRFLGWLPGNRALVVAAERADLLQCFPVDADGSPGEVAWTADWPQPTCLTR